MIFEKYGNDFDVKTNCVIFNPVSDRDFWDNISSRAVSYFENELKLYEGGVHPPLTASLYREYYVNGNRSNYEKIYFSRRSELICKTVLECYYNDNRYMNDILDLVWLILEETSWTLPAHNVFVKEADSLPDFKNSTLDLFLAETACTMAFVYQVVGEKLDKLSKVVTRRIRERLHHDIIEDCLNRNDYWWMGYREAIPNNWNPWINSNILAVGIITEDNEKTLKKLVEKVIEMLDIYLNNYPLDGGCDEGPSYWNQAGLSMLECLWLLKEVTNGKIDCFSEEKVINTSEYFMKMYAGNGKFVNFADSNLNVSVYFATLFKIAKITENKKIYSFSKSIYESLKETTQFKPYGEIKKFGGYDKLTKTFRMFDICKYLGELESCTEENIQGELDYYIPSLEVMISKTSPNNEKGLFIGAKGGHNGENHNHNDVGNFIVYKNSVPFIVDSGNMTYQKITFSDKRYTLWTTRSSYHNVPVIGGFEQKDGKSFSASDAFYEAKNDNTIFSLNLKNAYENKNDILKWVRTIEFDRKNQAVFVTEAFEFEKETEYVLNFLTPQSVNVSENTVYLTSDTNETLKIEFENKVDTSVEKVMYDDSLITANWGEKLYRISIFGKAKEKTIKYAIK